MKDINNAKKALQIQQEISDLEYFVEQICNMPEDFRGVKEYSAFNISVFKSTELSLNVYGKRMFGRAECDKHEKTIKVPYSLFIVLKEAAKERINELRDQIEDL